MAVFTTAAVWLFFLSFPFFFFFFSFPFLWAGVGWGGLSIGVCVCVNIAVACQARCCHNNTCGRVPCGEQIGEVIVSKLTWRKTNTCTAFFHVCSLHRCTRCLFAQEGGREQKIVGWGGLHPLMIVLLAPSKGAARSYSRGAGSVGIQGCCAAAWRRGRAPCPLWSLHWFWKLDWLLLSRVRFLSGFLVLSHEQHCRCERRPGALPAFCCF